jgi:hypothetical protein
VNLGNTNLVLGMRGDAIVYRWNKELQFSSLSQEGRFAIMICNRDE